MQNLNTQRATRQISALSLAVVIVLYLAHALPLYFYNVALPAILRHQGVDLRWIGMLSLLYIPWAFKFLWAPHMAALYTSSTGTWSIGLGLYPVLLRTGGVCCDWLVDFKLCGDPRHCHRWLYRRNLFSV